MEGFCRLVDCLFADKYGVLELQNLVIEKLFDAGKSDCLSDI